MSLRYVLSGRVCNSAEEYAELLEMGHWLCHLPSHLFELHGVTGEIIDFWLVVNEEWYVRAPSKKQFYRDVVIDLEIGQRVDFTIRDGREQPVGLYRVRLAADGWVPEEYQIVRGSQGPWFEFPTEVGSDLQLKERGTDRLFQLLLQSGTMEQA